MTRVEWDRTSPRMYVAVALAIVGGMTAQPGIGAGTTLSAPVADRPVVSVAWLAEHLKDPELVLLHVGERAQYDREHIPGARFVQLRDLAVERDGLVLELPGAEDLRQRLERLGIGDQSRVVVYFGKDWYSPSTRVLFTLDAAGLGARSALLDGGMPAWTRAGKAVTTVVPAARLGRLSARAAPPLVVDAAWVHTHAHAPGVAIIDARAPMFYDGPAHGEHRAGHVPGAANIPFSSVADDSLLLLPDEKLAALFRAAGVQRGDTVVAYCHIGQQATAVIFAARVLGHPVRLFDGSFEDWSRRTELPVEGGSVTAKPAEGSHR